jgi:hypothetical protein
MSARSKRAFVATTRVTPFASRFAGSLSVSRHSSSSVLARLHASMRDLPLSSKGARRQYMHKPYLYARCSWRCRRVGATLGPARDRRRRPAFVVVRALRRRLHGPCSARKRERAAPGCLQDPGNDRAEAELCARRELPPATDEHRASRRLRQHCRSTPRMREPGPAGGFPQRDVWSDLGPGLAEGRESGGPGESHPRAPTDPGVTVSRHRALLISIDRSGPGASG